MNTSPKISIITCVYNGDKYIAKLLDSVLNLGYSNIEHIIINDGSTDETEKIISQYSVLYKNKKNANLYIKYVKQDNMGLGYSTNVGLKEITGKYWTWINCDDWYEKNAFDEAIGLLESHGKIDYVQLNGYFYNEKSGERNVVIKDEKISRWKNKKKLFIDYCCGDFRFALFLCKTSSYKKICPSMQIYPSRFTQDVQFVNQIFSVLNGWVTKSLCWNFLVRDNNYCSIVRDDLLADEDNMRQKSIELLSISSKQKDNIVSLWFEENALNNLKKYGIRHDYVKSKDYYKQVKRYRKKILLSYKILLDKKPLLYLIYAFIYRKRGYKGDISK